jgi:hypothetical protein
MDSYGMYFGDASVDTIKYCVMPLTYLVPQVQYSGPPITDTLNWTAISGTFTAAGDEKYLLLGNFKSDAATNTVLINPSLTAQATDLYIDDVSVIELNAPAYAGPDRFIVPGDSAFVGSPPDVGVDEACMWYLLPNDTVPIDTVGGFYVKPTITATYVVRQEICGLVKWDTVVVHPNPVGIADFKRVSESLIVKPNPASDKLSAAWIGDGWECLQLSSADGKMIRRIAAPAERSIQIELSDLPEGIYIVTLKNTQGYESHRRLVIRR